jgi:predicted ATPase
VLRFGDHRLDLADQRLWHGEHAVPLGPKAFAVLQVLVERAGRLVTKDEILDRVWPDTHVGDAVLKTCILEIRKALGDDSRQPRFVETLHRRGYRFLPHASDGGGAAVRVAGLCGRHAASTALDAALARAAAGQRQIVFVSGDAGIGKTTLVEAFLQRRVGDAHCWVGRGQCFEVFGAGEPYRPVLDALERFCRRPEREQVIALLRRHAPTWLLQLPALLDVEQRAALQRELHGVGGDRMPREMAEVVEALTANGPLLILVLEDLHWSDAATLDLLSALARRNDPCRLLVIATYRPVDAAVVAHPLRDVQRELVAHRLAHEIGLDSLSPGDVEQYLAQVVPGAASTELAAVLHARTGGLPLFLASVVDALIEDQRLAPGEDGWRLTVPIDTLQIGIPESIRRLIEAQIERVESADRELLAAGSLAGDPFSVAIVAPALERDLAASEARCAHLAARGIFLRAAGVEDGGDGDARARFGFRHALYRQVLYDSVPEARRVRLARRIGELTEAASGGRVADIAAELASHFEAGRDWPRAIRYRRLAAEHALACWAYRDALLHLDCADGLLGHLRDAELHAAESLALSMVRGPALVASCGYGAEVVQTVFARAHALCRQVAETPLLVPALWGLCSFYAVRGDLHTARELAGQCDAVARRSGDAGLRLEAHHAMWVTSFFAGELVAAEALLDAGLPLYDRHRHADHVLQYGQDAGVAGRAYLSFVAVLRGRPDESRAHATAACELADELGHPLSRAFAALFLAWMHGLRGEHDEQRAAAEAGLALATEHGFPFWSSSLTILLGYARARGRSLREGVGLMERGIAALRDTGADLAVPAYLTLLAEAYVAGGQLDAAQRALDESAALADASGQQVWRAETFRLQGVVAARRGAPARADAALRAALDTARRQDAVLFELRAAVGLATLRHGSRRPPPARTALAAVLRRLRGGRELAEVAAARTLAAASPAARRKQ